MISKVQNECSKLLTHGLVAIRPSGLQVYYGCQVALHCLSYVLLNCSWGHI